MGTPTFKLAWFLQEKREGFTQRTQRAQRAQRERGKLFVNALGTPNFSLAWFNLFAGSVPERNIAALEPLLFATARYI